MGKPSGYGINCAVATLLVTFVVCVSYHKSLAAVDTYSERLKTIEKEIEKTRKELEKGEHELKKLKTLEKKATAEIDHKEKEIETVQNNLRIIKREENTLSQEITLNRHNYELALQTFQYRAEFYTERLRSMYKRQNVSPLGMLFTAGPISAFLRGFTMLKVLAETDLMVLNEIQAQTKTIEWSLEKLRMALEANKQLAETKRNEEYTLANAITKKRRILKEIRNDEKSHEELIRRREEYLRQAQTEYERVIREREKAKLPAPSSLKKYSFASRKGKLPWPIRGHVISGFGKVVDSKTKTVTMNRGIEIETKHGIPVASIGSGEVVLTQFFRGYGNFVMIAHPTGYYTIYGHLSDILVNKGDIVYEGTTIGLAGNTGLTDDSSPRLVLEVLKGENPENPLLWLQPGGGQTVTR